ncbi:hypothetical protein M2137_001908 [Parabacteroides sp. PFB2-10]|uniref:hypothetical protein n=1 Tax=Parabacteroides sp. PFB2-10 TaxID=1742405 RepID=UPI00247479C6|nr:hypothetical protein [Parabacteroides sp. PFB2-10]MDH6313121.1 hypothetical protein [Parabacteroides sp. PFB2-10]
MSDNKAYFTGIASEYLVLSMLYRRKSEAFLSMGNKKAVDILILQEEGTYIEVDVKSVSGYASVPVNNIEVKDNRYVVFVIYRNKFEDIETIPDFYIVPSKEVVERCDHYKEQRRIHPKHIKEYKDKWELIVPASESEVK